MSNSGQSVLHVLPTFNPRYGGPVAVATGMCRALEERGIRSTLLSMDGISNPGEWSIERFDKENRGKWGYCFSAKVLSLVRDLVRVNDVVHIHGLWNFPASAAAWFARKEGIPYIITPHGMLTPWSISQSRVKKSLYLPVECRNVRGAAALHFFTHEESQQSVRWGSLAETFILPNGIPVVLYDRLRDRERMEQLYPVLRRKVVLLFLGRLHPGKGLELLIPAFSQLLSTCPECILAVCGPDAEYGSEVERMVLDLGLSKSVLQTGLVVGDTKRSLFGGADVFILPSRHEGDSVTIKEAMQAGLPVVITPQCGFNAVAEADAGIVVEPQIEELVRAMEKLVTDSTLRLEMGVRGKKLVESIYTWDKIIPGLMESYKYMIARNSSACHRRTDTSVSISRMEP